MTEQKIFEICFTLSGAGRCDLAERMSEIVPNKFKFAAGFATGWGRSEDVFQTSVAEAWADYCDLRGEKLCEKE